MGDLLPASVLEVKVTNAAGVASERAVRQLYTDKKGRTRVAYLDAVTKKYIPILTGSTIEILKEKTDPNLQV